jgi:hypothetical protein
MYTPSHRTNLTALTTLGAPPISTSLAPPRYKLRAGRQHLMQNTTSSHCNRRQRRMNKRAAGKPCWGALVFMRIRVAPLVRTSALSKRSSTALLRCSAWSNWHGRVRSAPFKSFQDGQHPDGLDVVDRQIGDGLKMQHHPVGLVDGDLRLALFTLLATAVTLLAGLGTRDFGSVNAIKRRFLNESACVFPQTYGANHRFLGQEIWREPKNPILAPNLAPKKLGLDGPRQHALERFRGQLCQISSDS